MRYQSLSPYLDKMVEAGASDLFVTVGFPPSLRIEDKIFVMDMPALEQSDVDVVLRDILSPEQHAEFKSKLELNMAITGQKGERFRVNVFQQMHQTGLVIRRIKSQIPTLEELKLPSVYADAILERRGLVLIVGPTGSGKSTSLASMIDFRNRTGSGHVITIEDPIEYVFNPQNCIFTQREVGVDTASYQTALKNALRQSPDVIMIGEIRDREVLESAMLFCETGRLVVATLHADNTNHAVERLYNLFPEDVRHQFMITLSQNLKTIIAQRLVESVSGTLTLAHEVLLNEGFMRELIEKAQIKGIKEHIEKSSDRGMQTLDQSLLSLQERGIITQETAIREADNPGNVRLKLNKEITLGVYHSMHKPQRPEPTSNF